MVKSERLTVDRAEGFVVFLIGMRINKWWLVPVLWAVGRAFNAMMRELEDDPDSGLLSHESFGGRTTLAVQYWRSPEDLHRYARAREKRHAPAWAEWIRRWGLTGAVGIWHETYLVEPDTYECIYHQRSASMDQPSSSGAGAAAQSPSVARTRSATRAST